MAGAGRFSDLEEEWTALIANSREPNVFLDPAIVSSLVEALGTPARVVLAWASGSSAERVRLVGVWVFVVGRPSSRLPIRVLVCPLNRLTFLGTPVIEAGCHHAVLAAMLDAISADVSLPKILCLNDLNADGPVLAALGEVLAARRSPPVVLERRTRAKLEVPPDGSNILEGSLSSRKRADMRRYRRRLAERGELVHVSLRCPDEVGGAFEKFLVLEGRGWKGKRRERGMAIILDERLTAFARSMIVGLARKGRAGIEVLQLNGMPVAMNIWLRSGSRAFGWKMAYDETFRSFSPGALLMQDVTAIFCAAPALSSVDSCNRREVGITADFWAGRHDVTDMLLDARPGGSLVFRLLGAAEFRYRQFKGHLRKCSGFGARNR